MNWYKIVLFRPQFSAGELVAINARMADVLVRTGASDLALFRKEPERVPFDSMTYYLPPCAEHYCSDFLAYYKAELCERPEPEGITVEVGNTSLVSLLSS